ncbi:MAG: Fructose dehydrogenase large subunit [Chroococcidiopsis sp. SAG 2025]|uniref:GMC family oxidoreductase n=1 Tax=Chroococcidiopsis sp. SAG 2025 TaxID=171389 RepID=UPI0029371B59|nr:GMC family oxidoreductase [Chroococcidiopsis sp. SAG 2025]MDV2996451.1 Fructose dehydrogenase large subunit [Chroococcidiopsis sp. SAG 2025]
MLVDALKLPAETLVETDICIIGAGAAGITLARELRDRQEQVCLLESGGLEYEEQIQSLYAGENTGLPYFPLKEARGRYFGGSTNLWGGWSRPMDEIDFEHRPWMPYSGWCFSKAELDPYYERAQTACHLGLFEYDLAYWQEALAQQCQVPATTEQLATYLWQIIPCTHLRFGEAYRAEIEQASNITTYLHANVLEIETNDSAQAVTRLRVASSDGKQFSVAAKVFVLAAGGIENPRLLLASNRVQSGGVGNQHDLVGRFFMEHPYLISGKAELSNSAELYTRIKFPVGETFLATGLGLSKEVQEREQILNFGLRLLAIDEWLEAYKRLRSRTQQTVRHKAFPSIAEGRKNVGKSSTIADFVKVASRPDRFADRMTKKLFQQSIAARQFNSCDTHLIGEQAPNPDSRVILSRDRDKLGMNRVQLDWRLSPIDKYTIARSQQLIAAEFERSGLGKIHIELTDDEATWRSVAGSYHHIGTTRMSSNPKEGVVNEHCQVHGIHNLYIAGSSVFPTSGLSNPTLTIVALAIRLADRLKDRLDNSAEISPAVAVQAI